MPESPVPSNAAEQRVHDFITDYAAQWQIAAPHFDRDRREKRDDGFQIWRELMAPTTANHFLDTARPGLAGSFSTPASHGPEVEEIERSEIHNRVAYVLTRGTGSYPRFHEYELRPQRTEWRIATINTHFDDPTERTVPREKVDEQLLGCTADAPLLDMPPGEAQLDENFNFTPRTVVKEDTNSLAEVSTIGNLVTTTGAITVADFGYENTMARPLARLVPPGTYPVDRVTAFGRNAAIRVRFTGELPVSWHPAGLPDNEGHVIGIDGGLVCIVDYADYGAMTGRQKAAALNGPDDDTQPTGYTFPAGGTSVGVAAATGWGDGTYPVYWGIDAHGNAAQLVVDFMVLVSDGAEDDDEQDDGFIYVHI